MAEQRPRLVFGDDGSAAADVAWLWINNHRWPEWTISVVTAQQPETVTPIPPEEATLHEWEPPVPRELFERAAAGAVEFLTAKADPRVLLGSISDAALVAIGPRGTGVLKAMHIGSVAEWMVASGRPVVIVRSARPTRTVVVCVDGSPAAQRGAETLASMPWIGDCDVTLLGVSDGASNPTRGFELAEQVLQDRARSLEAKEAAAIRGTLTMDAKSVILDLLAEWTPDLVVVGTRGLSGVKRLLLGSTASTVARYTACSILVASAGNDA